MATLDLSIFQDAAPYLRMSETETLALQTQKPDGENVVIELSLAVVSRPFSKQHLRTGLLSKIIFLQGGVQRSLPGDFTVCLDES